MNSMTSDGKMDWQNALADKKNLVGGCRYEPVGSMKLEYTEWINS